MDKYKGGRGSEYPGTKMRGADGMKQSRSELGQASKPYKCDSFAAQRSDLGKLQPMVQGNRGYPQAAWAYKY